METKLPLEKNPRPMQHWKTDVVVTPTNWTIDLNTSILTIGSCFSQSIGQRLAENKFNVFNNPFGTSYHPIAIHHLLKTAALNEPISKDDYLVRDEIHFHYQFHSNFGKLSQIELEDHIAATTHEVNQWIKKMQVVLITYGTAWLYKRKDTQQWVANCHKLPSHNFTKELMSIEAMEHSFDTLFDVLTSINPSIKIIVTVSPVRHLKDTLELNSVSKSCVRVLCHRLSQRPGVEYFPAFELMMDDLRDYRFYQEDRIHPTHEAEEYIWEKFSQKYFSPNTLALLNQWQEIKLALKHRSAFPTTDKHQAFLKTTLKKLEGLRPHLDVSSEMRLLSDQIQIK